MFFFLNFIKHFFHLWNKNKWTQVLKISRGEKKQFSHTNKAQFSLFCEMNPTRVILVQNFPKVDMRQLLTNFLSYRKIAILSVFCKSGIYRKLISRSLCFAFLMANTWDFCLYIPQFHFRLKFFHKNKIKKNWYIYTGKSAKEKKYIYTNIYIIIKNSKSISITWWNLTDLIFLVLICSFYFYKKECILVYYIRLKYLKNNYFIDYSGLPKAREESIGGF